jgi:hypothetical protein
VCARRRGESGEGRVKTYYNDAIDKKYETIRQTTNKYNKNITKKNKNKKKTYLLQVVVYEFLRV